MAFLDRFKKKKEGGKNPVQSRGLVARAKKEEMAEQKTAGEGKRRTGVLLRAHLTEKTAQSAEGGAYAFAVNMSANKFDIKRAVEGKYGVRVVSVRTVHTKAKARRRGMIIGQKPGFKKAIITVAEGQKIEIQ